MKTFTGLKTGRVHLLHLTRGDDLLKSIRKAAEDLDIKTAIVTSGIGSLRKTVYHYTDAKTEKPQDVFVTVEQVTELISLQGIILEGEPHLHALFTENGGKTCHGGHVEEGCEILYLSEISIVEAEDLPVGRRAGKYGTVTHFEELTV